MTARQRRRSGWPAYVMAGVAVSAALVPGPGHAVGTGAETADGGSFTVLVPPALPADPARRGTGAATPGRDRGVRRALPPAGGAADRVEGAGHRPRARLGDERHDVHASGADRTRRRGRRTGTGSSARCARCRARSSGSTSHRAAGATQFPGRSATRGTTRSTSSAWTPTTGRGGCRSTGRWRSRTGCGYMWTSPRRTASDFVSGVGSVPQR
jgi:hypothetical protein